MKALVALLLTWALIVPAGAGSYTLENRPAVVFKGNILHQTPYPQNRRSTAVWQSDACWRGCKRTCTWDMETCVRVAVGDADACRPQLDACDRSCMRTCRGPGAGPLLGFIDW